MERLLELVLVGSPLRIQFEMVILLLFEISTHALATDPELGNTGLDIVKLYKEIFDVFVNRMVLPFPVLETTTSEAFPVEEVTVMPKLEPW